MAKKNEDYELAGVLIGLILENAAMYRLPHEDGKSPAFCLALNKGNTLVAVADALSKHRETN